MNSLTESLNILSLNFDFNNDYDDRPWINQYKRYSPGIIGLDEEIEDFYNFMSHTPEENEQRLRAVRQVQLIVNDQWPHAVVETYGSFRTELYLPTSDVDCVINVEDVQEDEVLTTLRKALISANVAESATVIKNTRVPVLKFVDKSTAVMVDIVANKHQGVETSRLVQGWCKESQLIPKLFLVLKQFLQFHRIGNVYKGGLSSYSLIIMIVCFLRQKSKYAVSDFGKGQYHCRKKNQQNTVTCTNGGQTLIDFLDFYGLQFDYVKSAITIKNVSCPFVPKEDLPQVTEDLGTSVLVIQDPLDENNNIARGTFRAVHVQEAFAYAASKLKYPIGLFHSFFPDAGFLGRILRVPGNVMKYRAKVLQIKSADEDLASHPRYICTEQLNDDNRSTCRAYPSSVSAGPYPISSSPYDHFDWMRLFVAEED